MTERPFPYLTVREAAKQTHIPTRTLKAHILQGRLRAHKTGPGHCPYLIKPADLARYIKGRK